MDIIDLNSNSGIITGDKLSISAQFTELTLLHESEKGYSRLFKGKRLGKWHSLKTLKLEYADNLLYQGLLQKEFEIAYPLSHPNIIQTIGIESVPDLGLCIIMEYIDGYNLRQYFSGSKSDKTTAVRIISDLCSALNYIHSRQIIHRDLKPENILITRNGANVKLIDFGLSDTDSYVILKQPAGTLGYASPEQQSSVEIIDNRADIYSLGIILEEIKNLGVTIPNARKVISGCKAEDRNSRFPSVSEISNTLNRKSKIGYYMISCFILLLIVAGSNFSYRKGFNKALESMNPHNPDSFPKLEALPKSVPSKPIPNQETIQESKHSPKQVTAATSVDLNANKQPESIGIYGQLAAKAKELTNERCRILIKEYDTLSCNSSFSRWSTKHSSIVLDVKKQIDSLLEKKISKTSPEYDLYKTSLQLVIAGVWNDCNKQNNYFQNRTCFKK